MRNHPSREQFVLADVGKSNPNPAQKQFKFRRARKGMRAEL
jgi:hypothetical protein